MDNVNQNPAPQSQGTPPPQKGHQQTGDNTTIMAILAYLGILIVVPFAMAKDNPFVKFHIKQGLVLVIIEVIYIILMSVLGSSFLLMGGLLGAVYAIVNLAIIAFSILGIINAAQGKQKELPFIGSFASKFNF